MMKIHFTASLENMDKRIDLFRFIENVIERKGHTIIRKWAEEAYSDKLNKRNITTNRAIEIEKATRSAINECDLVIIEATDQSFGVGYQAAIATSLQKPTLIIQETGSRPIGVIGSTANTIMKTIDSYSNLPDLEKIINSFIDNNNLALKDLRFNMLLDRELLYFLEKESANTGLNKSQVIRNLLKNEIKKNNQL